MDSRRINKTGNFKKRSELADACQKLADSGLTLDRVAQIVGVSQATVSRILSGDTHKRKATIETSSMSAQLNTLWRIPDFNDIFK